MKKLILLSLFSTFAGLLFLNCNQSTEQKVGSCNYYDTKIFEVDENISFNISSPLKVKSFSISEGPTSKSPTANFYFKNSDASVSIEYLKPTDLKEVNEFFDNKNQEEESKNLNEMIFKIYDDFFKEKPQLNPLKDLQFKDGERSFKGRGYTFDDGSNQFDYYNIYGILNGEHLWIMYRNRKDHVDRKVDFDFINCLIKELKFKSN
jgi:hypothetical protein